MCTWGPIIALGRKLCHLILLKPCEDLVKTVNVVNVEPSCTAVRLHVFLVLVNSIEQELKIQ